MFSLFVTHTDRTDNRGRDLEYATNLRNGQQIPIALLGNLYELAVDKIQIKLYHSDCCQVPCSLLPVCLDNT